MKKVFLWLFAVLAASCSTDSDSDVFYQSYGVVKENAGTSGKLYIRSDEGKIIIPTLSSLISNEDRDKRVWMIYSTNDDVRLDTIKANMYDFIKITQIDFKRENDDITSDEVSLQEIWVAQDYLTLIMDVAAGSENSLKNHLYNMYSDTNVVNYPVRREFKYDRKNDSRNVRFKKIVALKLDDKINPAQGSDSVIMVIKYRMDTGFKEKHIKYKK
jgi:hypothetical protein